MTPGLVEGAGVELAYHEHGAGRPAVFVHGTASTGGIWREVLAELGEGMRAIAYDRRGYGGSGAPDPYAGTTVEEQAEDAAALIRSLDAAPAVLCAHSFGAVVCLDLLCRHPGLARAAVLIEPPLWSLSPAGSALVAQLRDAIEAGARDAGVPGAIDAFVAALAGSGVFARLGRDRLEAAHAAPRAAFADFGAGNAWQYSRAELRGIAAPVVLLRGSASLPIWADVMGALTALIPGAEERVLDGGHMLHLDRSAEVAAAVRELAA